jgi:hypothetical protein
VCIFVTEDQICNKIDTSYCAEQTSEVCATELETKSSNLRILALFRAPSLLTIVYYSIFVKELAIFGYLQ